MTEKYRFAFVMGGGVSLGAFSGGAFAQVLRALQATNRREDVDIEVDVFAGASAGAITLALGVHELIRGAQPTPELRRLWVDVLDTSRLYADNLDDHREPSLFASRLLQRELERLVALPKEGDRSSILGKEVALGFSLSNMNGFRFDAPLEFGDATTPALQDAATTTLFSDRRKFFLTPEAPPTDSAGMTEDEGMWVHPTDPSAWRLIADTAVTSGAFPGAFSPRVIARHSREYGHTWGDNLREKELFAYVDGGLFNNEPLKLAIEMARMIDDRHDDDARRVFIVIDPALGSKNAHKPGFYVLDDLRNQGPNGVVDVLKRVIEAVQAESTAKDWLKAARKNNELKWFQLAVESLANVLAALPNDYDPSKLTKQLQNEVESIIKTKFEATSGRALNDATQVRRYRKLQADLIAVRYKKSLANLDKKRGALLVALIALLENAAGLRKKQTLTMLGIAPEKDKHPAAGAFLSSFGGFLDKPLREHDFQLGRACADHVLTTTNLVDFVPDATAAPPAPLTGHYGRVPKRVQRRFEAYVGEFGLKLLGAPENWLTETAAKVVAKFAIKWAG
jgi:hypothetical protein